MARGSKPGERRGGRRKGTQNRRTIELKALTDELISAGVTPLEMILTTARDLWAEANKGATPNLGKRMQAVAVAEKAMPYLHPKLANVSAEITGKDGGPVETVLTYQLPDNGRDNGGNPAASGPAGNVPRKPG